MNIIRNGIRMAVALLAAAMIVGVAGIQPALAASAQPKRPSKSDVFVIIQSPVRDSNAHTLSYTLTASNIGTEHATDIDITVPLNPAVGMLQNIQFSGGQGRLLSQTPSSVDVLLDRLDAGAQQTVMLTLWQPSASSASPISDRASFSWRDNGLDHVLGQSNQPWISPTNIYNLAATPNMGQSNTFGISGATFVPGEPVTFWLNAPNGQVLPLYINGSSLTTNSSQTLDDSKTGFKKVTFTLSDNTRAGLQGELSIALDGSMLAPGSYSLVAQGFASKITAVAPFQVQ
jgi:hypothetical protein